jgi:hypothetical protein
MTDDQKRLMLDLAARLLRRARDEFHETGDEELQEEGITEADIDRTIALMEALREKGEGLGRYGYIGQNRREHAPWFHDEMTRRGILEVKERTITTRGAPDVIELAYQNNGTRFAYLLTGWYEVDSPYEDSYVFSKPIPDNEIINVIRALNALI